MVLGDCFLLERTNIFHMSANTSSPNMVLFFFFFLMEGFPQWTSVVWKSAEQQHSELLKSSACLLVMNVELLRSYKYNMMLAHRGEGRVMYYRTAGVLGCVQTCAATRAATKYLRRAELQASDKLAAKVVWGCFCDSRRCTTGDPADNERERLRFGYRAGFSVNAASRQELIECWMTAKEGGRSLLDLVPSSGCFNYMPIPA